MADVSIELTAPSAHAPRVLAAFNGMAGMQVDVMVHSPEGFHGNWSYSWDTKDGAETNKDFAERVFREMGKAIVRLWDYAEDHERYRDDVALITLPAQDVPDDIIT